MKGELTVQILMSEQKSNTSCCCGKQKGRVCCKRQYQCATTNLGQLDKRLIKLIELQVSKLNVVDKTEFPIFLRFETQGQRILILNCYWISATRFAIRSIDYKSFSQSGEYLTLISLFEDGAKRLTLKYCRNERFENATKAFEYLCKRVRVDMEQYAELNPATSLTKMLEDAEAHGSKRKEPQSNQKAA